MGSMVTRVVAALMVALAVVHMQPSVVAAGLQSPEPDIVTPLFASAVKAQQAGDFAKAEADYKKVLDLQPRHFEALANLGVVLVNLGRFDEAIASYRKALELSYLNGPLRLNLALAYYKAARYAEALPEFDKVLQISPGLYNATLLKADCHLQIGEPKQAIALLDPLSQDHADDAAFDYVIGMALLQDKQTDKGLVYLDRILKHGESAEAHILMGMAKQAAADYAEAREEFRRAVELNPEIAMGHSLLGQTLLRTGDRDGAKAAFQKELTISPNDFESNLYLGVILKEDSDFAGARPYFDRAQTLRPNDPGVKYQIASLLLASGDTAAALPRLEALVKESPNFVEAHVSLATAYYRMKRKDDGDRERAMVEKLNQGKQGDQGDQGRQGGEAPPKPPSR
jgi:tetratricopeptide (TPR) repeat protein